MIAAAAAFSARPRLRPHAGPTPARRYKRRHPEKTPLLKIVSENLESSREWREAAKRLVPRYVEEELRGCLQCGLLCFGFGRDLCTGCGRGLIEPGRIRKILTHLGEPLESPPVSPARGPPTDWGELVPAHGHCDGYQASPDELPAIDIHSL